LLPDYGVLLGSLNRQVTTSVLRLPDDSVIVLPIRKALAMKHPWHEIEKKELIGRI
jgi:hypothetical protein